MKNNIPITNIEQKFDDKTLVSVTNLKGVIIYGNHDFVDISGFSTDELLDENHNIVRHPDMPAAAFEDMWNTLKRNEPWMGIVKNRCKNGDYYWVEAFVEPIIENGKTTGYVSTRVKPEKKSKDRAEQIYRRIRAGKNAVFSIFKPQISGKITGYFACLQFLLFGVLYYFGEIGIPAAVIAILVNTVLLYCFCEIALQPLKRSAQDSRQIVNNSMMQQVFIGSSDDVGQLQLTIKMLQSRIRTIVRRLELSTTRLGQQVKDTAGMVEKTGSALNQQQTDIEQVQTSTQTMMAAASEIANSAAKAAEASNIANGKVTNGALKVTTAIGIIDSLATDIGASETVIQQLSDDSENIGGVLDVIKSIAQQTNLLALNAAIEAARAGEQGRGFAVVADEVRTLANRSQKSAEEINNMIDKLQTGAQNAVLHISKVRDRAAEGVSQVEDSAESLADISGAIRTINQMNEQISAAIEEQGRMTANIDHNMSSITEASSETAAGASHARESNTKLTELAHELTMLVAQFDHSTN